jgi:hypothetical protein
VEVLQNVVVVVPISNQPFYFRQQLVQVVDFVLFVLVEVFLHIFHTLLQLVKHLQHLLVFHWVDGKGVDDKHGILVV